jgi:hypothetical protein
MQICASELLLPLFDRIANEFSRRPLGEDQRQSIALGLVDKLSWVALTLTKDHEDTAEAYGNQVTASKNEDSKIILHTSDRFASNWVSRGEIIQEIANQSKLSERLAQIALLLMEIRADVILSDGRAIDISEVGEVRLEKSQMEMSQTIAGSSAGTLPIFLRNILEPRAFARFSFLGKLFGSPHPYIRALVESLELSELIRPPLGYVIKFRSAWTEFDDTKRMEWKEARLKKA